MPNFQAGQDLLTPTARQTMLEYLESELPETEEEDIANANHVLVPEDDLLSIYDADFIAFIQEAITDGDLNPCKSRVVNGTCYASPCRGRTFNNYCQTPRIL